MTSSKAQQSGHQYEAIDPSLPADHWDESERSKVEELGRQLDADYTKDPSKVAIQQNRVLACSLS